MSSQFVWKQILSKAELKIDRQNFDMWLKPISLISIDEKMVRVAVSNRFSADWIKEHYGSLIQTLLKETLKEDGIQVEYVVTEQPVHREEKKGSPVTGVAPLLPQMNRRYTFDSFVIGNSNQFATAASRKVAEQPGVAYNPFFIYGGVGLGKTHLLNAIGNAVLAHPSMRVTYLTAEQFTNDVVSSIAQNRMVEFRNKYRMGDVLLIDDIQFLAKKERTQEEFFHAFNTLYEANKQIVIASDRPAKEIPDIDERLRSRFAMGLMADIQPPDVETKMAILRKKAETEKIEISNEVIHYLASHLKTNVRELEGALIRLGAFSSLAGETISVELAKRALRDSLQEKKTVITLEAIQKIVAHRYQVTVSELKSKRRTKQLVFPRQVAMSLSRELTSLSLPEIGAQFGGRDHATVIHAIKQIEKRSDDFELQAAMENMRHNLKEG